MKNYINIFYLLACASIFQNCIGSANYKKLNAGYYLSAIDVREDMLIGFQDGDYGIGVIPATIFSVGQNDEFIIAKQHPKESPNGMDKGVINYFIIPQKTK